MDPVLVVGKQAGTHMGKPIHLPGTFALPFKHHAKHRHRIPKARYRVTNWSEYDASLRRRGSLTVWFTDEAIQAWRAEPRTTPGGQPRYSALAITTALTMGMVFHLALRQTEGLIGPVIGLLDLISRFRTIPLSAAGRGRLMCRHTEEPQPARCICLWTALA